MDAMRKFFLTGCGMAFHVLYFYFTFLSFGNYEYSGEGHSKGFQYMLLSILALFPCLLLYLIDGILAFAKNRRRIDLLRFLALLVCIPFALWCIGYGVVPTILWNVYFLLILVWQTVSLFLRSPQAVKEEDAPPEPLSDMTGTLPVQSDAKRCAENVYTPSEILSKALLTVGVICILCALRYAVLAHGTDLEGPHGRFSAVAQNALTSALLLFLTEAIVSYALHRRLSALLRLIFAGVGVPIAILSGGTFPPSVSTVLQVLLCICVLVSVALALVSVFEKPHAARPAATRNKEELQS